MSTNSVVKDIKTFFDEVVEGFDATNLAAGVVRKYKADASRLANTNQSFQRPIAARTTRVDGRDLTGQKRNLTKLTVPVGLNPDHMRNVFVDFQGSDLNNEVLRQDLKDSSVIELASAVDEIVVDKLVDDATLLVTNSGNIDTYSDLAEAKTIMTQLQCDKGKRNIFLNPEMATNVEGNLASRETMRGIPTSAYTNSDVPMIAGFKVYQNQYVKPVTGSSGTGYLVNGANQNYTPLTTQNDLPVDNRTGTLIVDGGSGAAVGDFFTIAATNSVGQINTQNTGKLRTFRIKAINGATWTISPPIIPADGTAEAQQDYATVNTTPADNAVITILNTVTKPASVFYKEEAVELVHSSFNLDNFQREGKLIGYASTSSGLDIAMLCDSDIVTMESDFRFFIWCNPVILRPECVGLYLEGQT